LSKEAPKVLVVDEAHRLLDTLLLLCGTRFSKSKYRYPDTVNEVQVVAWMQQQVNVLSALSKRYHDLGQNDEAVKAARESEQVARALRGLREAPHLYAVYEETSSYRGKTEKYLNVTPVEVPGFILRPFLEC